MRALTLTQPWAGLVASGIKLIENRPRAIIKREDFGKPFAIHASRAIDDRTYARISEIAPELAQVARNIDGGIDTFCTEPWFSLSRVTSAIVGVATVERVVIRLHDGRISDVHNASGQATTSDKPVIVDLGDQLRWFFGPLGYVLRDVRMLAQPVPCPGRQGFWTMPGWETDLVEDQLGAAA